jgi:hypothetical protein
LDPLFFKVETIEVVNHILPLEALTESPQFIEQGRSVAPTLLFYFVALMFRSVCIRPVARNKETWQTLSKSKGCGNLSRDNMPHSMIEERLLQLLSTYFSNCRICDQRALLCVYPSSLIGQE